MHFARKPVWIAISIALAVTACGGGGGGGSGGGGSCCTAVASGNGYFAAPQLASTYSTYSGSSNNAAVQDVYTADLTNSGSQNVVVAGRQVTQVSSSTHVNYNLQVFGFNSSKNFVNQTSQWFAPGDNNILGTEPAIKFADFNGSGFLSMFVASGTDMSSLSGGPGIMYINSGHGNFTRVNLNLGSNIWAHDTAIADFDGDGVADVLVSDYNSKPALVLGSRTNNFRVLTDTTQSHVASSGMAAGDFMGNGTQTVVMTDSTVGPGTDTNLYSVDISSGSLVLNKIAALPGSRFNLAKYASMGMQGDAHDIRALTYDFDNSGRPGVIVFSSHNVPGQTIWHGYTEVQFLKNMGGGNFVDVTDTILTNFDTRKSATYQPQLIDVNNDGLLDIFMSATDYTGAASTSVLLQTRQGKFTEQFANVFSDFSSAIRNAVGGIKIGGNQEAINIVNGPDGVRYLVSTVQSLNNSGQAQTSVFLARVGPTGVTTPQASITAIQQQWPWLNGNQAASILAATALTNFDGYDASMNGGIINLDAALRPVGSLGIMTQRGAIKPITGGIYVPGFNSSQMSNIAAVDSLGRNFNVNLSATAGKPMGMPVSYSAVARPGDTWSSKFAGGYYVNRWNGMTLDGAPSKNPDGTDRLNYTMGISSSMFLVNRDWDFNTSVTQMQGSPWVNFYGMYGQVNSSTIIDSTYTKHYGYGFWSQHGLMQTITDFNSGLVSKVDPIYSTYHLGGWRNHQWSFYGGMQPYHVGGNVQVSLPTGVNMNNGSLQYTNRSVAVQNNPTGFAGIERRHVGKNYSLSMFGVANTEGQKQVAVQWAWYY